jgi:hypothetical protein
MKQIPDGQQSKQIETNLKRLRGVRLGGSQESKGNQSKLVTLCGKRRDMHQTESWTLLDGGG